MKDEREQGGRSPLLIHPSSFILERTPIMARERQAATQEMNIKVRPLDDRVLVEPLEAEEKTAGGILLPDTAKEKPQRGKVIAVGPGKLRDSGDRTALSVKVGDEVLFGKYAGSEVKEGGKELKVLRESDILAKIGK